MCRFTGTDKSIPFIPLIWTLKAEYLLGNVEWSGHRGHKSCST